MGDAAMTRAEREVFLADVHVGVLAVEEPGRGPLAIPIWYRVDEGQVVMVMGGDSLKARLLRAAGRATFTVQDETPPYRYVSVEGPVSFGPRPADDVALATRYLGPELGRWYVEANPPTASEVEVRLRPERCRTYDYAKVLG